MSFLLIVFAAAAATNPGRMVSAAPTDPTAARKAIGAGSVSLVGAGAALAWWSGPLITMVDVSSSSAMIAAGIAVLVIGSRDALIAPPTLDIATSWRRSVAFPMFFPTMFTPGLALTAVAAGAERGVLAASLALLGGISVSAGTGILLIGNARFATTKVLRILGSSFGLWAVAAGAILATRGVQAI